MQGASPLSSGYEAQYLGLLHKLETLREILRDCASLQCIIIGRVVWQIHVVQETWGSKDYVPAAKALSSPTSLATTLRDKIILLRDVQKREIGDWTWQLERKEETARERECARVTRQQWFEDLLKSLVGRRFKLLGLKIYQTHWSCEGQGSTGAHPVQVRPWLKGKAYKCVELVLTIWNHNCSYEFRSVWGLRVEKPSAWATVFQVFSTIQGKIIILELLSLSCHFCPEAIQTCNYANAPGQHMWQSLGLWSDSKCSKPVEVRRSCKESKPCRAVSVRDLHGRNHKKVYNRERSNINYHKKRVSFHSRAQFHA